MRKPVSIRHLILYGLLTCYTFPVILIVVCWVARYEPSSGGDRVAVLFGAPVIGFFGSLIWCIRFVASDPAKTRLALIVVLITSAIAFFALAIPSFSQVA